jgi:hypothetical protein
VPSLNQLKAEVEKIPRNPYKGRYQFTPYACPMHSTWQGKEFIGNLLFNDSPLTYQVYECPGCGRRDAIERTSSEIDADDPRYIQGTVPTEDWVRRMGVSHEAEVEGKVIFDAHGRPRVIE